MVLLYIYSVVCNNGYYYDVHCAAPRDHENNKQKKRRKYDAQKNLWKETTLYYMLYTNNMEILYASILLLVVFFRSSQLTSLPAAPSPILIHSLLILLLDYYRSVSHIKPHRPPIVRRIIGMYDTPISTSSPFLLSSITTPFFTTIKAIPKRNPPLFSTLTAASRESACRHRRCRN